MDRKSNVLLNSKQNDCELNTNFRIDKANKVTLAYDLLGTSRFKANIPRENRHIGHGSVEISRCNRVWCKGLDGPFKIIMKSSRDTR
jgi:hypothetical protein